MTTGETMKCSICGKATRATQQYPKGHIRYCDTCWDKRQKGDIANELHIQKPAIHGYIRPKPINNKENK